MALNLTSVTSVTGSGPKDWFLQRITAVYFLLYVIFLFGFILLHPKMSYTEWYGFFQCAWVKIATLLAWIAFFYHAWVGIWTVSTDYIKHPVLRFVVPTLVMVWLLVLLIWGILILWGQVS